MRVQKAVYVAALAKQRIVENRSALHVLADLNYLALNEKVAFPQLLHKLPIRQAFAQDRVVAAILRVPVVDALEPDGHIAVLQHPAFVGGQPHAVDDLQRRFHNALIAVAAVQQVFPRRVFHVFRAAVQRDGEHMAPSQTQPVARGLQQSQPSHVPAEVIHHAGGQIAAEHSDGLVEPFLHRRRFQRQRRIQQGAAQRH